MDSKILRIRLSFGSNFDKLRMIGAKRVWWNFLVHIQDRIDFINGIPRYSKLGKNLIWFYLRKASCDRVEF